MGEPLKQPPYGWVNKYGENVSAYSVKDVISAVEWLKEKWHLDPRIRTQGDFDGLLSDLNEAFPDLQNVTNRGN